MESSGRGRIGLKGRLARTFHKAPKQTASPITQYYSNKVVNVPAAPAARYVFGDSSHATNSYKNGGGAGGGGGSTSYVPAPSVQKHKPPNSMVKMDVVHAARAADGGDHVGDDNIDMRAALYISSPQERFRLSQIDHDWW